MTADVPQAAARLAGELADAFEQDQALAERLNAAQQRLQTANDRLWSGLHPDALGLVYDGAAAAGQGASAVSESVGDAARAGASAGEVEAVVLGELQRAHWAIHRAFCDYQQIGEDRRHLAAEIGELIAGLVAELIAAGWTEQDARAADVRQLATAGVR
ncbi:MAG: hypothetical protein ACRDMX_16450 [Solirubrobacteraceae bacterium]